MHVCIHHYKTPISRLYLNVLSSRSLNCFAALGSAEVMFISTGCMLGKPGMGYVRPKSGSQSEVDVSDHLRRAGLSIGCILPQTFAVEKTNANYPFVLIKYSRYKFPYTAIPNMKYMCTLTIINYCINTFKWAKSF